jgi:hypothetical protein
MMSGGLFFHVVFAVKRDVKADVSALGQEVHSLTAATHSCDVKNSGDCG